MGRRCRVLLPSRCHAVAIALNLNHAKLGGGLLRLHLHHEAAAPPRLFRLRTVTQSTVRFQTWARVHALRLSRVNAVVRQSNIQTPPHGNCIMKKIRCAHHRLRNIGTDLLNKLRTLGASGTMVWSVSIRRRRPGNVPTSAGPQNQPIRARRPVAVRSADESASLSTHQRLCPKATRTSCSVWIVTNDST